MAKARETVGSAAAIAATRLIGQAPEGKLPLTDDMLLRQPSGDLFGLTQNVGMGLDPELSTREPFLIISTQGGLAKSDGTPVALGYHTGHWELHQLVRSAAETLRHLKKLPFAAACSDPCDGRTQGTPGMMDSLPYRNDAAIVFRRLIRSLPGRKGVLGIASCDKGLPAVLIAVAGSPDLPAVIVPGGVTLPSPDAEDAGTVQTIGARFSHGLISREYASEMGCKACGSPGGGCQFLGTAASAQVAAESIGISLPHSALCPSGEPVWLELAERSARALVDLAAGSIQTRDIISSAAIENAMLLHAAFGGSTNLLLHIPAVAHAAGLQIPGVEEWIRINRNVPRLVDALPNGPRNHPTVQVFMAGGVPEVMLHLRRMGLLNTDVLTASGLRLDEVLDCWEESERRRAARNRLKTETQVDPGDVIFDADRARRRGITSTVLFPSGNLAPEGSVVKATAIDSTLVNSDNVYEHRGRARVFVSESRAIQAIKAGEVEAGDVLVLIGLGPMGTGMEEIYQITSALKFLPRSKEITILTDGRFSGVSTGPCIGHIGPEALAGGPLGRVRDGDLIQVRIDRRRLKGSLDLIGVPGEEFSSEEGAKRLESRPTHPDLTARSDLPADTRLWAQLQQISGGVWKGAVYDVEAIVEALRRSRSL